MFVVLVLVLYYYKDIRIIFVLELVILAVTEQVYWSYSSYKNVALIHDPQLSASIYTITASCSISDSENYKASHYNYRQQKNYQTFLLYRCSERQLFHG